MLLGANTVKHKLAALDLLEKHDVATTLLPAVAAGLNDDEVGALLELVLAKPHIRSLELHTLTFTGQGGVGFQRTARITIPDLHRRIEEATAGRIDVAGLRALAARAPALLLDLLPARARRRRLRAVRAAHVARHAVRAARRTRSTSSRARSSKRSSAI